MTVKEFVRESNRIEGIHREPTEKEVLATIAFIELDEPPTLQDLVDLVKVYQPDARLRDEKGLDVRVGPHVPPEGGDAIPKVLTILLKRIQEDSPFEFHQRYETLHPFTDGNGRSGRALWLWQMFQARGNLPPLGFLHSWYYQSLQHGRAQVDES